MITNLDTFSNPAEGWQRSLYAFLAEKEQRSAAQPENLQKGYL